MNELGKPVSFPRHIRLISQEIREIRLVGISDLRVIRDPPREFTVWAAACRAAVHRIRRTIENTCGFPASLKSQETFAIGRTGAPGFSGNHVLLIGVKTRLWLSSPAQVRRITSLPLRRLKKFKIGLSFHEEVCLHHVHILCP